MIRIIRTKDLTYRGLSLSTEVWRTTPGKPRRYLGPINNMPQFMPIYLLEQWDQIAEQVVFEKMIERID